MHVPDSDEDVDREGGAELLLDMDCEAVGLGVGSNTTLTNRSKAPSPLMVLSWCNWEKENKGHECSIYQEQPEHDFARFLEGCGMIFESWGLGVRE